MRVMKSQTISIQTIRHV